MEPDDLLCSRNARSSLDSARDPEPVEGRTPLVGRAQWKINQCPSREVKKTGRSPVGGSYRMSRLSPGLMFTNLVGLKR
jgi:hypothetical protein